MNGKRTKPTPKQKKFIQWYIATGNATLAASKAYKVKDKTVAWSIWCENLKKPYIEADIAKRLQDAKDMIYTIAMSWEKDDTRVRACQDIIDRVEWKATQKIVTEWSLDVRVDYKTLSVEELINLAKKKQ
jgi:phage terminase small subunit